MVAVFAVVLCAVWERGVDGFEFVFVFVFLFRLGCE